MTATPLMLNTGDHNRHKTTNAMLIWVWPARSVALGPAAAKSQLGMGCNLKVIKSGKHWRMFHLLAIIAS